MTALDRYVRVTRHGHPLADQRGRVSRHRLILWETRGGPVFDRCVWCGYRLPWITDQQPAWKYCINVDHLNGVKGDDRVENLVSACSWCNTNRSWAPTVAPIWWERFCRWFKDVHPSQRPSLPAMVSEVTGIPVGQLLGLELANDEELSPL